MKIAILSLKLHSNYGGILQSYALQTVLERMGHEVEVLNMLPSNISTRWGQMPKRILKKLMGGDVVVFSEFQQNKERDIVNHELCAFRSKYIHEHIISSFEDIKENDYDCFVVGSDQVWRPKYFKRQWNTRIDNAYLSFTKGWKIKRIAYAVSFGVDTWEQTAEEIILSKEAAKLFDVITVREQSGISLIKEHLGIEAKHVLDPTMLLSKDDYIKLIENSKTPKSEGNLLTYILNKSSKKDRFIAQVARDKGLKPFSVNKSDVKATAPIEDRILPSIEQWLRGFYDAEFVITDSFHACVFSIIFGKPFIVIGNTERGLSRFTSLLGLFGLEKNMIIQSKDYNSIRDYSIFEDNYKNFQKNKEQSILILKDNLES